VDVMILDVDEAKRRISLGIKQALGNPHELFAEAHPPGTIVEGEIRNITEFGLFIGLPGDIDGLVHVSDLSWDVPGEQAITAYNKGDMVKAKVLDVDVGKARISLGVKQLEADPAAEVLDRVRKGDIVTCVVSAVESNGIEVKVEEVLTGFIRRAELGRDRADQRPERFSPGERVDARVTMVDRAARRLTLTIKGKEIEEDRAAVAQYGTSDSGASLGDVLAAAIRRRNQAATEE
jgi:small subunit ribosomal protein S1